MVPSRSPPAKKETERTPWSQIKEEADRYEFTSPSRLSSSSSSSSSSGSCCISQINFISHPHSKLHSLLLHRTHFIRVCPCALDISSSAITCPHVKLIWLFVLSHFVSAGPLMTIFLILTIRRQHPT